MANAFVNFLKGATEGSGNLRDWHHASRLYLTNYYELSPKAAWIYYVELNLISPEDVNINDLAAKQEYDTWYQRNRGKVGLLAKSVSMPKLSIKTESMNQYNRKTVIQTKIDYEPITITFHDDMANVTTNLWKSYYQYYYADSLGIDTGYANKKIGKAAAIPWRNNKFGNNKYKAFDSVSDYNYGLNNKQNYPFFVSIDVYQLYQQKYTLFKIVNPLINDWSHSELNQSQGSEVAENTMILDYETVVYDTNNKPIKSDNGTDTIGFTDEYYDKTPSPLSIGGRGTTSILGPGGLINGASSIFGSLAGGNVSPLGLLNAAIQTNNLIRNARNISLEGVFEEGSGVFQSVLSGIESDGDIVSGALQGLQNAINPAGLNIPLGSQSTNGQTVAKQKNIGGGGG